jgi:LPS sulfotransferase NodH
LRNNGLGLPKEHIKEQIIYLMKHRQEEGFDLRYFFNAVAVRAIQNGYFGTKIISHFLEETIALATEQESEFLATWISSFKFIYLYRSDKVMQAVSLYRAEQTQLWHNDNSEYSNSRTDAKIEYNFQQIQKNYNFLLQQENYLLARVSQIKKQYNLVVLEVAYEELVAHPQEVVSDLALLLGSTTPVRIEAQEKRIHGEREISMAKNFQSDYRELYSTEPIRNFHPVYD